MKRIRITRHVELELDVEDGMLPLLEEQPEVTLMSLVKESGLTSWRFVGHDYEILRDPLDEALAELGRIAAQYDVDGLSEAVTGVFRGVQTLRGGDVDPG